MNRSTLQALVVVALALGAPALVPDTADAQRVVVRPGRDRDRGPRPGTVVVDPTPGRPGGAVVVQPGRPRGRGAVVVDPTPGRPGVVVDTTPARPGGAVVVQPGRPRGGAVVVDPTPGRPGVVVDATPGGAVVVAPRTVVRSAPSRVMVVQPPPPPRVMTRRPPPSRHGEVWVEPYWAWDGMQWVWVDGHWDLPPQPGAIWMAPQWDGRAWVPGYWTMASVYDRTPQVTGMAYQIGQYTSGALTDRDARDASGSPYQDYVVWLSAGETATFVVSGGPSDRFPGRRVDIAMQLLLDGRPIANAGLTGPNDAQLTFTAPRASVYTLRIATRGGPAGTGTYLLESAPGQWAPQISPYDQYWGGATVTVQPQPQPQYVQPLPQAPDCRSTLLQMGHAATNLMFCDNAEPFCADQLLRMGHSPTNLMFCQGVQAQCAVQLLQSGRSPTELQFCR
jgi:hypothetical protein